jgi:LPS export ABC transporter protein LptC
MGNWQGRARWALGMFVLIFGVIVFFAIGRRQEVTVPAEALARLDPDAVVESTGAQVFRVSGSRQDFVVEMARQLTYADGRTRGEIVKVTVDERAGRSFVLRGREAEIAPDQTHVELRGDVQMDASDGLAVSTEHATYDRTGGIVRAPGPLQFSRGRLSGSGVGATWDQNRQVLWLVDQARIVIAADGQGQGAVEIASGAAGLAQADQYARFERGVRVVRDGQTAEAASGVAYLKGEDNRLDLIELRGGSRIVGGAAAGALERMEATDMNLAYAEDGQTLTHATLAGNAAVVMAAGAGAGRSVAAEWLDIGFSPDGATVTSLAGRDRVELELPGAANAPTRQIRSATLEAAGVPGQGLTSARFEGQVEFREQRPAGRNAPALSRVARARTLDAMLRPGTGAMEEARFSGGVIFEDGGVRATAPEALYGVGRDEVELRTVAGGVAPRVIDGRTSIEAREIDLSLQTRDLVARQEVRSVLPGGSGAGDVKRPAMLQAEQDIFGTADHLEYMASARQAVYRGGARLWQDDASVMADEITLDEQSGNLTAKGAVRSVWTLEQASPGTEAPERVPSIGAADEFVYDEAARRATYVGQARVSGPQGNLHAGRIELHLDETGRGLQRAEAYDDVRLVSEERTATGVRMTYFAADGRYIMNGTPVRIVEECRETTGKTLTFFRSTDTITVDGNEERHTQTVSGSRCPER